jgi:hypothetical protein
VNIHHLYEGHRLRHRGPFGACHILTCIAVPAAERAKHEAQVDADLADTAARNMQTSEGVPEFDLVTSEGRGALLLYVDKLHRKVAELAGQSHTTAAHQGEHCANIVKIVDKVNSIRAFAIATAKATEVGLANVDRFEQELVDRVNEMWSEVLPLIEAYRAGRVEAWANTPFGRGDHPLTFENSGQLAEAVYARLRTADAWASEPEPESDADDVKWLFAEHHRGAAAVLATMYAAVTANEPVTEVVEQHGVSPYSPSDHEGIKAAWGQHPGHPGGYRFEDCPHTPCGMWTPVARYQAGERFEAVAAGVKAAGRTGVEADWISPAGVVHPLMRDGRMAVDKLAAGAVPTWALVAARQTHDAERHPDSFEHCGAAPCEAYTEGQRESVMGRPGDVASTGDHLGTDESNAWMGNADPSTKGDPADESSDNDERDDRG